METPVTHDPRMLLILIEWNNDDEEEDLSDSCRQYGRCRDKSRHSKVPHDSPIFETALDNT
jgi:hypothetical protein